MQISHQAAANQRTRLVRIRNALALQQAKKGGRTPPSEGEQAIRATRYCLYRRVSPAAAMAAHRAALEGEAHNADLAYLWARGLILALTA